MKFSVALFASLAVFSLTAHAHHEHGVAMVDVAEHELLARRSLGLCSSKLADPQRLARRQEKRNTLVKRYFGDRTASRFARRSTGATSSSALSRRQDSEVQCILAPELTIGPYYVDKQLIRPDMRESEPGIELLMDVEFVDVNTCEPLPDVYVDFWHCNTTGVYSGVAAENTVGATFNRGIQPTDADGVVQMITTFPGWYNGRATHIHIAAHLDGTVNENGTYTGGKVSHIGQIFFPEDILTAVDSADVYKTNRVSRLKNANDGIFNQGSQTAGYIQEASISYVGATMEEGLIGHLRIGIDPTANHNNMVSVAGEGGFGGPGGPGGMGPPPGGFPSGFNFGFPPMPTA